jgi:general secretion pathway protein G
MATLFGVRTIAMRYRQAAVTLIELLIVVAMIGSLAAIAINSYQGYVERARVSRAVAEIAQIALMLERYNLDNRTYPATLADLRMDILNDPWGQPYQYLPIAVDPPPKKGKIRKDKNLNPLNSDFDLYSMGPDGQTQTQLTAAKARDDIVRANNGAYIGVAENH